LTNATVTVTLSPVSDERHLGIEELAGLGGVTRRTVRYYVQEGLLPAPSGVGRGSHYGPEHLERLLAVKAMQERGESLEAIRRAFTGAPAATAAPSAPHVPREVVTRVVLGPGLELLVSGGRRLPSPGALAELAAWCGERFRKEEE
jgi:DNA-binding transcriptional MerR regulator